MGGKSTPDAPDYSAQINRANATAEEQLQLGRDQHEWAMQQDAFNRDVLNRTLAIQLPAMEEQANNAREDRQRYEDVYRPQEDQLIQEASEYDSETRKDQKIGQAMADVTSTFDAARRNALSRLEGYGVDPSQTRNAALDVGVRTQQAAALAAAGTGARNRVEDTGRALRADVVNLGKGLPSQVASSYGQSVAAGQAGVGGANSTTNTSTGALTSGLGFTGAGMAANNQAGNMMSTQFNNQMGSAQMSNANNAATWQGVGSAAGMVAGLADGGKVGKRSAIPVGEDKSFDAVDRGISETYGASEYNTPSKLIPRALPPYAQKNETPITPRRAGLPEGYATGGPVDQGPTDGSGVDDQVPAMLSVGEYIIPADVVAAKGKEFFDKILQKYHTPAQQQRVGA